MAAELLLLLLSDPQMPEALRVFWLCGADNAESTGAGHGREVSQWASYRFRAPRDSSCSLRVPLKQGAPSFFLDDEFPHLVLKTANVRMRSESREPETRLAIPSGLTSNRY